MRPDPRKGKIDKPYRLSVKEHLLLKAHPPATSKDWEKYRYSSLKKNIKDHYSIRQNDYCVYCRTKINFKGYKDPIEHIVDKDGYPTWMFNPLNLALACDECNTRKGTKDTLRKPYRKAATLPTNTNHYRIVHPHYDDYELHIEIEDDLFYRAITKEKGYMTILICGLWHFQMLMKRAEANKIEHMDLYKTLAHRMQDLTVHRKEKKMIRSLMNELIARRNIA